MRYCSISERIASIRKKLSFSQLEEAIKEVFELISDYKLEEKYSNTAIMISATYYRVENKGGSGVVAYQDAEVVVKNVIFQLLRLTDTIVRQEIKN